MLTVSVKSMLRMIFIDMMDIRPADLGLLVALQALLTERSVTRAADRLGLSQPAMSAQLARLRDLFDDPLLVQSGRRMVPTARAADLEEPLGRLLKDLGALVRERRRFEPAVSDRVFRVMATDYMHRLFTLPVLSAAAPLAPAVRMAMLPQEVGREWRVMEDDKVDVLVASERLTPPEARSRILGEEGVVMVQRKGHPRGSAAPDLDAFCALDHVLVSPDGGGFVGATDTTLKALGRSRRVVASLPSFLLAAPLVVSSDLVAVLPEGLARTMTRELDLFPLPFASARFRIVLSWHARAQNDEGHRWLRDLFTTAPGGALS
ncbi:LysR family transcriptional regulator [Alsobacter sp. KACC 23698]|uniref:LysR family transcriptional regulator n=1 Tax=Alsobacter sp. KACC 23698 TaxID=3149229 RepID=A0AAU7J9Y8_9HYPH